MPKLVIVESPTKAKTLSKFLPKNTYEILASNGHIRDLPKSGLGVDVDHDFTPEYVIPEKATKTINALKKAAKGIDEIILATDPDREGEAISWHLQNILTPKKGKVPTFGRVVFHELTKEALEEAFKNVGTVNLNLVDSQQARRVLDRLVGYKLSPLLWKKVRYGLSAGRVQSVAVRLIVERERERGAFKPEEYWSITVSFIDSKDKKPFTAILAEKDQKKIEVTNEKTAKRIEAELRGDEYAILEVKKSERRKNAYPPLKTSTLQQAMANGYGFSAKKTMTMAQKLFEKGYITYHRTDSLNLAPAFISSARSFAKKQFGASYIPDEGVMYKTKSKNAQEAHEAIRPTDVSRTPDKLKMTSEEIKTYSVIWRRAIASQMMPAVYDQTSMYVASKAGYGLKASGSVVKFDGWMVLDKFLGINSQDEETAENGLSQLPNYLESEIVNLKAVLPEQHFTQPPARYSDATLIKKLEELGIGRPSTYAPTISTISARGYVKKDGRYFVPEEVSLVVTDLLVEHFPEIVDYSFTAEMEEDLDEVAEGQVEWVPLIRKFYLPFDKSVKEKDKTLSKHDITNLGESDEKCPECGKPLIFKLGKYGKFLSCSGYPECAYLKSIETEDDISGDQEKEDFGMCDKCNEGKMILKAGRFGKFLACERYPKCKNTKPFLKKIGIKCPTCGEGDVVVRFAKKRKFFGCSRYPDCDWSSWKIPESPSQP
ncbi:DNA topoisomerase I [candidate division WWE3 bacterium RIFOXYC1_FULL_40_10]|uniref:DNA topoisomerase 1 n=1 Tax=candidate division WWE3 bacterium RIFOXYA2_FULL_46_9 TaxID=1802636 RepID=A0A1F4W233_UNCKA|nr:MAG: DNA topoisomerase I [candidate division WWE3 bacterium RIFOXYB1_FULL_40_22]OGC61405.1 MAG: DNA topoisomerase I [candidate division WWE3 bacterium RIFOXYA1_FULL_40_11]OGC63338.1 MAG: DNA topoisomerase I [candidate division WWE3 bacterium RIFOXYA2_FULL_46_9]OGC65395.1 MAG: DNA topoisomerase I [candidate division WWE3 bacterium RIFOXYB2_FULL_41_6]OGC65788.1 MAG: DNA topoisomerase I [candidate division WWE3 bacterium RIFOXYC1_FULL_40_10]OGC67327.1 MAG: DNA topoisomerase I [candidate divisi